MCLLKMYILAAAVILIHMSAALASSNCTPSVNNDAWKFLKTFKQGYAKYVTVNLHKICIIFEQTQADATTKKAIYNVSSISTDNGQANPTMNEVFQVQECPTDMEVHLQSAGNLAAEYTVLYSDFTTCSVFRKTHSNQCRLRIKNDLSPADITECLQQFYPLCGTTLFDVYNEVLCPA